uniref:phosphoribosylaminoimidazolesuccinocarboxamide synthase n=1 Tax=Lotharella globosa TaxID=91324 RepID=A0A6U3DTR2_9EUKA|mmetsp:Transcript_40957/g.79743  ORF Transcript_40957/g.79743 Transcript_40957/m.79743 type:complete len:343 (-) Transcript_40957:367-1395(-)
MGCTQSRDDKNDTLQADFKAYYDTLSAEDKAYFDKGVIDTDFSDVLGPREYKGKVRDVYKFDEKTSLFVVSDRISAFDYIHRVPIPGKGKILNQLSVFWFEYLAKNCDAKNHVVTSDIKEIIKMKPGLEKYRTQLEGRCMVVKKLKMIPVEAVCRAYLTGSGFKDYKATGKICGHDLREGYVDCEKLDDIIFTPATKAEVGLHDENITEKQAEEILTKQGFPYKSMKESALKMFKAAIAHAEKLGIIIADTKFEFGMLGEELIVGDEVLTPDSSRYWEKKKYEKGHQQDSLDKQYLRNYLLDTPDFTNNRRGVPIPREVCEKLMEKYTEIYKLLTSKEPEYM